MSHSQPSRRRGACGNGRRRICAQGCNNRGVNFPVVISRQGWDALLKVSIPIEDRGWLVMPISDLPPRGVPWWALGKWLLLIIVGAMAIAVFVANRMVRPLVLLESAVESVGPDVMLPELPERGPGEVRATAKALNTLSARLKRAMESRMRLVAAAGHDLRTPITRMRLRAEFVTDEEDRAKWLADLDELERFADSAVMLVREDTGHVSPEVIRLDELVRRCHRRAAGAASRSHRDGGRARECAREQAQA
jgi:signal transduction histidine kinase